MSGRGRLKPPCPVLAPITLKDLQQGSIKRRQQIDSDVETMRPAAEAALSHNLVKKECRDHGGLDLPEQVVAQGRLLVSRGAQQIPELFTEAWKAPDFASHLIALFGSAHTLNIGPIGSPVKLNRQ